MLRTSVVFFAMCLPWIVSEAGAQSTASAFRAAPNFGGVVTESVEAEGVGGTKEDATLRALDAAISQVNGRRVQSARMSSQAAISIDVNGVRRLDASSRAFAELIVSSSNGAVRSFEVLSRKEISRTEAEQSIDFSMKGETRWIAGLDASLSAESKVYSHYWRVKIRADVAKYEAAPDEGKPRLAVARTRVDANYYPVGDSRLPADEVGDDLRRRLNEALAQTERFLLLDRGLAPELQEEIAFINSGKARLEDVARIGQQLAADLLLVSTVERFEYRRHVRELRMRDRQLISYSGGGTVNVKLVNATTGEVVLARTFDAELPGLDASSQARAVDGDRLAADLNDKLAGQILHAVLEKIFPVSVVAISGDQLVLSQGGAAVREGKSYEVVRLGEALADPQTGRSLGRAEFPAGVARVDRVAGQTAYATLMQSKLPEEVNLQPGMLELRKEVVIQETKPRSSRPAGEQIPPATPVSRPAPREEKKPDKDPNW